MPNYRTPKKRASKSMIKDSTGGKTNQFGVYFSKQEQSEMISLVQKANLKRERMIREEGALDWLEGGKPTGLKVSQLQLMGRESDIVLAKRSKSFQRFKSRKEFEMYMANLEDVLKPDYVERRVNFYRENYIKSLRTVYGQRAASDIIRNVKSMNIQDFMKKVQQNEDATIRFNYTKGKNNESPQLNKIRVALGMKPIVGEPEEWDEESE